MINILPLLSLYLAEIFMDRLAGQNKQPKNDGYDTLD
jgi:hypothetical protein